MTKHPALTPTRRAVLEAARDGKLWRSERGFDLSDSYADGWAGARRKVTPHVRWLADRKLLQIGDQVGVTRPWRITDAGLAALGADGAQR